MPQIRGHSNVQGNVPDISSIVNRLQLKRELEIPILDTEEKINVKYARAGSGALSVEGFDTIQKSIGKGAEMSIEDAAEALVAFQVEWDLTSDGQPVPPTAQESLEARNVSPPAKAGPPDLPPALLKRFHAAHAAEFALYARVSATGYLLTRG